MSGFEWTAEVRRTMRPDATMEDYVLGMIRELAELADLLKRVRREDVPLDRARVLGQWGDIMWYQEACDILVLDGIADKYEDWVASWATSVQRLAAKALRDQSHTSSRYQGEARAACVAKLRARYPDGFVAGVKVGRDEP